MTEEYNFDGKMELHNFLEVYRSCPICQSNLSVGVEVFGNGGKLASSANHIEDNRIDITIHSDYYIRSEVDVCKFSISIIDGKLLLCDTAEQFVSIYDMDIILYKFCEVCYRNDELFHRCIYLTYDRNASIFINRRMKEEFVLRVSDSDGRYAISIENCAADQNVMISDCDGSSLSLDVGKISMENFPLSDKIKTVKQIQFMLMLS
jgi:hypothetical protein